VKSSLANFSFYEMFVPIGGGRTLCPTQNLAGGLLFFELTFFCSASFLKETEQERIIEEEF
jgi:hypothetical protein